MKDFEPAKTGYQAALAGCLFLLMGSILPGTWAAQKDPAELPRTEIHMPLAEAIVLGLRHNRSVKSAYLERVTQKWDLKVAEDLFNPDVELDAGIGTSGTGTRNGSDTRSQANRLDTALSVDKRLRTGGSFNFTWNEAVDEGRTFSTTTSRQSVSSWQVSFSQPLLKGAGTAVATAPLESARIQEKVNILSLKSTLIGTVNEVISAYRVFLQAQRQVEINRASLERSKASMETNRLLIETGRMAAVEIIQTRADIANNEFSYQSALNSLESARLNLLKILALDRHKYAGIAPVAEAEVEMIRPTFKRSLEIAFANRPDYLQARLDKALSEQEVMLAKNNMYWDLSLDSSYAYSHTEDQLNSIRPRNEAWQAGLKLNVPVYGDLSRPQRLSNARITDKKAQLGLDELTANIEIEIQDLIRDVESRAKQLDLARLALELAEKKLEIEQEKLRAGRSSNFQVVSFQNDLVNTQNAESDAAIAYRNSLTALDQALGTTLDTWEIEFRSEREVK